MACLSGSLPADSFNKNFYLFVPLSLLLPYLHMSQPARQPAIQSTFLSVGFSGVCGGGGGVGVGWRGVYVFMCRGAVVLMCVCGSVREKKNVKEIRRKKKMRAFRMRVHVTV